MTGIFNVYCDESCHLENDHQKAMVMGAIWCPLEKTREISVHHGLEESIGSSPLWKIQALNCMSVGTVKRSGMTETAVSLW